MLFHVLEDELIGQVVLGTRCNSLWYILDLFHASLLSPSAKLFHNITMLHNDFADCNFDLFPDARYCEEICWLAPSEGLDQCTLESIRPCKVNLTTGKQLSNHIELEGNNVRHWQIGQGTELLWLKLFLRWCDHELIIQHGGAIKHHVVM